MFGHQKEAVVTEGQSGSSWRLTTDEGGHINGTDLAPFPLGYYNAGLHADLLNRVVGLAGQRHIVISDLQLDLRNGFYLTGSFFKGTGQGFGEPAAIHISIQSPATTSEVEQLVADAVAASPAMATMTQPVANTFAIYVNGKRMPVLTMEASPAADAPDPQTTYPSAPAPLPGDDALSELIHKTGQVNQGEIALTPAETTTRIVRTVAGNSELINSDGVTEVDTVLGLPGQSHFALKTDERITYDQAPSGLALHSAGIAFCYMTQLGRYIDLMNFDITDVRLVQYSGYELAQSAVGLRGRIDPVDTHLFLSGETTPDQFEKLMHIGASTCYLHGTLGASLEPTVSVHHERSERR